MHIPIKSGYPYSRVDHFSKWLSQFCQKCLPEIPHEFNCIKNELDKIDNIDYNNLTPHDIKIVMKKLEFTKYYEYVPWILYNLTNKQRFLDNHTIEILKEMFIKINRVYDECNPTNRLSFMSYSYIFHKLCQIVDREDMLIYCPLLKSIPKLESDEAIWKNICTALQWQFIPSI